MQSRWPRALLALSSAILLFGGVMHGVAFIGLRVQFVQEVTVWPLRRNMV